MLASSSIERPKELDGKTYAGFGYPNEVPDAPGGDPGTTAARASSTTVTLDTAAYEALYQKRADFVITFARGRASRPASAGSTCGLPVHRLRVPGLLPGRPRLRPRLAGREPGGREGASSGRPSAASSSRRANPDAAAQILVDQNPGVFDANPELPARVARLHGGAGLLVDAPGAVGTQTLETWSGYSRFLYDQGLLDRRAGKPLTAPPDYASLFTNDFLPDGR